ncbi:class I SAM-dependent RNA methyltransferase [Planosporangium flavigriseum]|uniref:Putative RNA methyltransferase n=1 Tax=Planosporangium flavigriseum TaxID=373681 RepID=A0A8J3LPV1_9ACTN|nr:TRAM domain-containing protein [Planosporangium flavigriseum]NJC63947.1 class I SAM-dependent RNA methyltransferase [Planosporangium flavigriseum]GIG74660.1 putative RNA methyltransferase [Planosporangium flavigriseum]
MMDELLDLTVGPVAHGGHCVARLPDGQVVFVRHALPGERVRAAVTERRRGYLRADAVEVLQPSPDRVEEPCKYAKPGRCGGCDWQHATPEAQHELKTAVVRELLTRIGGFTVAEVDDLGVRVEPLPGGPLGWRTRVQYAVDAAGRPGFRKHRSHDIIPIDRCLIAHERIQEAPVTDRTWPVKGGGVEVVASSCGDLTIFTRPRGGRTPRLVSGPRLVRERAVGREWKIDATGFWQVHPAAPDALAGAVLDFLQPRPGERAWDLYGGAGLFAAALAPALGPEGRVTIVESSPGGVTAARRNLADLPQVRVVAGDVGTVLGNPRWRSVDLVVLDPPRAGIGREVVAAVTARHPRAVAYVSCDPAAFARDVATFRERGWRLSKLRGFDAYPMTQHVELVGLLTPVS